jgi:HSP20 family protein
MAKSATSSPKVKKAGNAAKSKVAVKPKKAARTKPAAPGQNKNVQQVESAVFKPIFALRRQIDELVEDAFGRLQNLHIPHPVWPTLSKEEAPNQLARSDFSENDKALTVKVEVPGMSEEDIEVVVEDGMLIIKGEKKSERVEKDHNYYLSERQFGAFGRSFRLPEGILEDKISAEFKKGVLTITMPKKTGTKKAAKRISIQSS